MGSVLAAVRKAKEESDRDEKTFPRSGPAGELDKLHAAQPFHFLTVLHSCVPLETPAPNPIDL
jgi:hypothetical protein